VSTNEALFEIGAPGVDVERIVEEVRATVAEKMQRGLYTDARVARAERHNLQHLKDEEHMLAFYLECLRNAVFVDIGDFEITERRSHFSGLLVALKRVIWKLLKFYTYRLWSQQNQVNGMLLAALEGVENRNRERIRSLEQRLAEIEQRAPPRS
jgi:hypothetical protein